MPTTMKSAAVEAPTMKFRSAPDESAASVTECNATPSVKVSSASNESSVNETVPHKWTPNKHRSAMEPRPRADEDAVREPLRPVVAHRRACVGIIRIVSVRAYWRWAVCWTDTNSYAHAYLGACRARHGSSENHQKSN